MPRNSRPVNSWTALQVKANRSTIRTYSNAVMVSWPARAPNGGRSMDHQRRTQGQRDECQCPIVCEGRISDKSRGQRSGASPPMTQYRRFTQALDIRSRPCSANLAVAASQGKPAHLPHALSQSVFRPDWVHEIEHDGYRLQALRPLPLSNRKKRPARIWADAGSASC
jgi:hypothetical protein